MGISLGVVFAGSGFRGGYQSVEVKEEGGRWRGRGGNGKGLRD